MTVVIDGTTGIDAVQNGTVAQADLAANVAGNGPAIRVARTGSAQSITANVQTKVLFDTVVFDTNSNFSIANSRFTPTIAGYYQCSTAIQLLGTTAAGGSATYFFKNGVMDSHGVYFASTFSNPINVASALIYCNGTTDYIEVYTSGSGTGMSVNYSSANNFFSAVLVRAA